MEEPLKYITWQDLKDFVNSIPEEFLTKKVAVLQSDNSLADRMNEPVFIEKDIWNHVDGDEETCGTLEVLKESDADFEEEFAKGNYEIVTPKGTPFLWIDCPYSEKGLQKFINGI